MIRVFHAGHNAMTLTIRTFGLLIGLLVSLCSLDLEFRDGKNYIVPCGGSTMTFSTGDSATFRQWDHEGLVGNSRFLMEPGTPYEDTVLSIKNVPPGEYTVTASFPTFDGEDKWTDSMIGYTLVGAHNTDGYAYGYQGDMFYSGHSSLSQSFIVIDTRHPNGNPLAAKLDEGPNCPDCPPPLPKPVLQVFGFGPEGSPVDGQQMLPADETQSPASVIDNVNLAYLHSAVDYAVRDPGGIGCSTCSPLPEEQQLPRFTVWRVHRYRDIGWHASFGPGVFGLYDAQLAIDAVTGVIEFFDPRLTHSVTFVHSGTGTWTFANAAFPCKHLKLRTSGGALTDDPSTARQATLTYSDGSSYVFDVFPAGGGTTTDYLGRFTTYTDRSGNSLQASYMDSDAVAATAGNDPGKVWRIASVTDAFGITGSFTYGRADGQWVVQSVACPNGSTLSYGYDGSLIGLDRVTFPDGTGSTFATRYDASADQQVLDIDDGGATGVHRRKSVYLTNGQWGGAPGHGGWVQPWNRVRRVLDADGSELYRNWVDNQAITLEDGRVSTVHVHVREGGASAWGVRGRRLDISGGVVVAEHRLTGSYLPTATTPPTSYAVKKLRTADTAFWLASSQYPSGKVVTKARDASSGVITALHYRIGSGTEFPLFNRTINPYALPLIETDALGIKTSYVYTPDDLHLLSRTDAYQTGVAGTTQWNYDARGQVTSITDPNGHQRTRTYDGRGFLHTESLPADVAGGTHPVTTWNRDAAGRLTSVVDPAGNATSYTYDGRNRVTRIDYADGGYETFAFGTTPQTANLAVEHRLRNGAIERPSYDLSGRRIALERIDPATGAVVSWSTWTYLPGTSTVASMCVDGILTEYGYDGETRLTSVTRHPSAGVSLTETTAYDAEDHVVQTTDAYGRRTCQVWDVRGRLIRRVSERIAHGLGTLAPASAARVGGSNPPYTIEDMTYDDDDRMTELVDAAGVRTGYAYDARDRVTSETRAVGTAVETTTSYAYDDAGNRTTVTSPRGIVTRYAYTQRDLVKQVTEADGTGAAAVVSQRTYTLGGQLASDTDANAHTRWWIYGGCCNRLTQTIDGAGNITQFAYDGAGRRSSLVDALTHGTGFAYDYRDRLVRVTDPLGHAQAIAYDGDPGDGIGLEAVPAVARTLAALDVAAAGITATTDPLQHTTYEIHDGVGRLLARIDALGQATRVAYGSDPDGLTLVTTTDPTGATVSELRDGAGLVRSRTDQLGQVTTADYDAAGRAVASRTAAASGIDVAPGFDAVYDELGRMTSRSDTRVPATTTSWAYDPDGNRLSETDAAGKTESYVYDARNRRTLTTDRVGGKTRFAYDAVGNLAQISDADNEAAGGLAHTVGTTQYAYDARNLLVGQVLPGGQQGRTLTTYGYDAVGQLLTRSVGIQHATIPWTFANPAAVATTGYTYDAARRLLGRSYSGTASGTDDFTYDDANRLLTAASAAYQNSVGRSYDAAGRLIEERLTIADGQAVGTTAVAPITYVVGYRYDADGRTTGLTYPDGGQVQRSYDDRGALTAVTWNGSRVADLRYDPVGRLQSQADANGITSTRSYVPGTWLPQSISAASGSFSYAYDAVGRKTSEGTSGQPAAGQTFGYDDAGRLVAWSQGAATASWTLSDVGDWTGMTLNGTTTARTHTAVHEATQVGAQALAYDVQGNLTTDQVGQHYAWDPENRLLAATGLTATTSGGAGYRYDALGRRIMKTVDGMRTVYVHGGAQVLSESTMPEPAQPAAVASDGDATGLARTPAGLDHQSGAVLPGATWTPSAAGVIRINFQPASSAIPDGYLADKGRSNAARSNGLTYGWTADETGNAAVRGLAALPAWDTLVVMGGASWQIDLPNGTYPVVVVAGDPGGTEFTDNLVIGGVAVTDPDPSTPPGYTKGDYDGYAVQVTVTDGHLVIGAGSGAVAPRLCFLEIGKAGDPLPAEVGTSLAAVVQRMTDQTANNAMGLAAMQGRGYVYGSYIDDVVAYKNGANLYYVHSNSLYSPAAVTDASGNVVERYSYDAYGTRTVTTPGGTVLPRSTIGFNRGFTGYSLDEETGLYYARARMYSPGLGRFLQRNMLGYRGDGLNLYWGAFACHANKVDPTGLPEADPTLGQPLPFPIQRDPLPLPGDHDAVMTTGPVLTYRERQTTVPGLPWVTTGYSVYDQYRSGSYSGITAIPVYTPPSGDDVIVGIISLGMFAAPMAGESALIDGLAAARGTCPAAIARQLGRQVLLDENLWANGFAASLERNGFRVVRPPSGTPDWLIRAQVEEGDFVLVTRNYKDFKGLVGVVRVSGGQPVNEQLRLALNGLNAIRQNPDLLQVVPQIPASGINKGTVRYPNCPCN